MSESFIKNAVKRLERNNIIPEKTIESDFVGYANSKKCIAVKLVIFKARGFPDRTILCPNGRIFFIEFKTSKGKLDGPQQGVRTLLKSFGFLYYVCRSTSSACQILDDFLNEKS